MNQEAKCWICGNKADSREHRSKKSDLSSLFGKPTQANPLHFHTDERKNFRVGSLNAKVLKSSAKICTYCNTARTQPHDRAWERLSEWLRSRDPKISPGVRIKPNRVFPYDTKQEMRNVHFYFLKIFGCQIAEENIPIDLQCFSDAIMNQKPHPNVYLAFGPTPDFPVETAGASDLNLVSLGNRVVFSTWFLTVGILSINILYAIPREKREGLMDAWHPYLGHKELRMATFLPKKPGK